MCLYIDKELHGSSYRKMKPFIAQTDIVVWKLLEKKYDYQDNEYHYYAPYRGTEYAFNALNKSALVKEWEAVHEGLHCFSSHRKARSEKQTNFGYDTTVFWGIIPKGSKVFVGAGKELVSNQLIVYKSKKDLEAVHGEIQPAITKDIALAT